MDRLILTFEDYNDAVGNIAYLNNASSALYQYTFDSVANNKSLPVYCALVEKSTGTIYAGTEKGVYYKDSTNTWNSYDKIGDLPVTSIYQQTNERFVQRNLTHTGITANNYVFAKTKWPYALYFGTYGRGIFMDMQYVTDTTNAVCDSSDYSNVGIPTVNTVGRNSLSLYPNPVSSEAHLTLTSAVAGNAVVYVYDLNGRCVMNRNLGHVGEGEHTFSLGVEGMAKGLYLVNVFVGGHTATAKMMVR